MNLPKAIPGIVIASLTLMAVPATTRAASYQVVNDSLYTATYTAAGPANPAAPTNPWATLVVPIPTITPFDTSLGTLVSRTVSWAPVLRVTAQGQFTATSVGAGPEASFGVWVESNYTGLYDDLGEVAPGPSSGYCDAVAVGPFTCGYSNEYAIAGTFFMDPEDAPPTSTFTLNFLLFNIQSSSRSIFDSASIAATVGFTAITTYEYAPAAAVPIPAAGWMLAGGFGLLGAARRKSQH